ncbi:D-alanyl-D-alanine carboxypeptidase family protein [Aeromicrobium sp. Leaf350]|uniref:M15 family metallopeptidase n=1 Tax=Aeromicrobium sp. Leaf350 TaxID=2876565 RepID=UPI001E383FA2|nr:M15 family metallopeptidase [Aeromicrobium sp. Leaf350]
MSTPRLDRRLLSAITIGTVAVALGVAATVGETRLTSHSHAAGTPTPAPTVPDLPVPTPALTTTPPSPFLDRQVVVTGPDGVLRIGGHVIVNKTYALPEAFGPGGLAPEVDQAFAAMQADAASTGVVDLRIISGYRSFARQSQNYAQRVASVGQEVADRGMARPGHSEHQTGLAIDVNQLSTSFGQTEAGRWIAANAHRFGFIVRYPDGKEAATGFKYEPWHLRYLGVEFATELTASGLTIEEYYGLTSAY